MDGGKKVWVPDLEDGFKLGRIVDISTDTATVETIHAPKKVSLKEIIAIGKLLIIITFKLITATYDSVFPSEEYENKDVDDNCRIFVLSLYLFFFLKIINYIFIAGALMYLNEANLLNNLRLRYKKDNIYVS